MDNNDNDSKTPPLTTTDKVQNMLKALELNTKPPVVAESPTIAAEPKKAKILMAIEDYRKQNQSSIDALARMRSIPGSEIGLWPDLWPEHNILLDEDVRSKVDFFQIPRSIRLYNALDLQVQMEKNSKTITRVSGSSNNDIN